MKIILGSSSKYRRAIFNAVTPKFESMTPHIDEKAIRDPDPYIMTRKIAGAKADALLEQIAEPAILVTSDQVVVVNGEIREKPGDDKQAREFLRSYANQPIQVVNGTVVVNTQTAKRAEGNDTVELKFKQIPEAVIDQLIAEGEVFYCAGALKAEDPLLRDYVQSQVGSDECLQGVSVELIKRLIDEVA